MTPPLAETAATGSLPDRESRSRLLRWLVHLGLPISLSIVLHLGIVGFLAVKSIRVLARSSAEIGEWQGTVVEAPDYDQAYQWSEAPLPVSPDPVPRPAPRDEFPALPRPEDLALRDLQGLPAVAGGNDGEGPGLGAGRLSLLGTGRGAERPGMGGLGTGLGGRTPPEQAGVWNLNVPASKIIYVVDFSGSIIVVVDELRRELKRSIGRLKPAQSFTVILFYSAGGGADEQIRTESFRPMLEPAKEAVRREFFAWIEQKVPRGMTEPLDAMRRALALEPDAIFFFSDGFFDDAVVEEIRRANWQGRTRIHCVVFDELLLADGSDLPPRETDGARRLRQVAEANGGEVKIVTRDDLRH